MTDIVDRLSANGVWAAIGDLAPDAIKEITRLRARCAELEEGLELTSGALQAGQKSMAPRVAFTGEWSHFGTRSVSEILDNANDVLEKNDGY